MAASGGRGAVYRAGVSAGSVGLKGDAMLISVEAWTINDPNDEEPCDTEMVASEDFSDMEDARHWAWDRLEEGFYVRIWRR